MLTAQIAETEELHRQTFNEAFISLGLPWTWSQSLYKELLRVTGGKERILHYLVSWHPQELNRKSGADIPDMPT